MSIEFKLTDWELFEGVTSVDVNEVLVKEGDVIEAGTMVCEVETDKVVALITCPHAGRILKVIMKTGESIKIGQAILMIESLSGAIAPTPKASPKASPKVAPAQAPTKHNTIPNPLQHRVIVCPACRKQHLLPNDEFLKDFDCTCSTKFDPLLHIVEALESENVQFYSTWRCHHCRVDSLVPRFTLLLPAKCICGTEHPLAELSDTPQRWVLTPLEIAFLGPDPLFKENLLTPFRAAQRYDYDVNQIADSVYRVFNPTKNTSYLVELNEIGADQCECSVFETGASTCIHIEHVRIKLGLPSPAQAIADSEDFAYAWFDKASLPPRVRIDTLGSFVTEVSEIVRQFGIIDSMQRIDQLGMQLKQVGVDLILMTSVRVAFSHEQPVYTDPVLRDVVLRRGAEYLKQAMPLLHSFQVDGAVFLASTQRALLLDEMGLGKTVQAIAAATLLRKFADVASVLVVAPKSVLKHWSDEIERFLGEQSIVISGAPKKRAVDYQSKILFKLVTLESLRKDFPQIGSHELVIIDEIHKARSITTVSSRILRQLNCRYFLGLSGTAIEKSLEDLFGIMRLLRMPDLESPAEFQASHIVCDSFGRPEFFLNPEIFAVRHSQCMLRRTKSETHLDLPPIDLQELDIELTPLQESMSTPLIKEADEIRERLKKRYELNDFMRKRWLVNRIVELSDSTKLLDSATNSSSKMDWLRVFLTEKCLQQGEKVVIFTRWTRVQELICELCSNLPISWVSLSGDHTTEQRQEAVAAFSKQAGGAMAFVSTDAGGIGINLQAARIVVNFEPGWNPSTDAQRFQRVHRIGQRRPVIAIMLLTLLDRMFVTQTHGRKSQSSRRIDEVRHGLRGEQSVIWSELVPVIDFLRGEREQFND